MRIRTHIAQVIMQCNTAAVYRSQLLCLMAMQDTKGISDRMLSEVIERWETLAEEYRLNQECSAGDEKLFIDAQSRGLPIDNATKERLLRFERNAWAMEVRQRI